MLSICCVRVRRKLGSTDNHGCDSNQKIPSYVSETYIVSLYCVPRKLFRHVNRIFQQAEAFPKADSI
jgi:hypothetical protein